MFDPHNAVMYIRNNDEAHYELAGSKLAADTMVDRVASLGLSVLGLLWTLGKTTKSKVYNLIHRDHTTVAHNVTTLIDGGYINEQVVSRKLKYISFTDKGKEFYTEYINKSWMLTKKLMSVEMGRIKAPIRFTIALGFKEPFTVPVV